MFSAKKALELLAFVEMQYPDNFSLQAMALVQALCMCVLKNGKSAEAALKLLAKAIVTFPGWEIGWDRTKKVYEEEAEKEGVEHAH